MANSQSPKEVLALGAMIVNELSLDTRGGVLQRWMAHYLAEQIAKADAASGAAKAKHERAAVNLILQLWLHRRALPGKADPLMGLRDAVEVLKRLRPESNPWARHSSNQPYEDVLRKMFDAMSRAIVGGILLTQVRSAEQPGDAQVKFMEPEEMELLASFSQWLPFVDQTPRPNIVVVGISEGSMAANQKTKSDENASSVSEEATGESDLHALVAENLGRIHTDLGRLLERWATAKSSGEDEEVP